MPRGTKPAAEPPSGASWLPMFLDAYQVGSRCMNKSANTNRNKRTSRVSMRLRGACAPDRRLGFRCTGKHTHTHRPEGHDPHASHFASPHAHEHRAWSAPQGSRLLDGRLGRRGIQQASPDAQTTPRRAKGLQPLVCLTSDSEADASEHTLTQRHTHKYGRLGFLGRAHRHQTQTQMQRKHEGICACGQKLHSSNKHGLLPFRSLAKSALSHPQAEPTSTICVARCFEAPQSSSIIALANAASSSEEGTSGDMPTNPTSSPSVMAVFNGLALLILI